MFRFDRPGPLLCLLALACDHPNPSAASRVDAAAAAADSASPAEPAEVIEPEPTEPDPDPDQPEELTILSRFHPFSGLPGSLIRIIVYADTTGCIERGDCAVTIGDIEAEIIDDTGLLGVLVPRMAPLGPVSLCVTFQGKRQCAPFEVFDRPVLTGIWPDHVVAGSGDATLTIDGDLFPLDAQVLLDGSPLVTVWSYERSLTAVVPAALLTTAGQRQLLVRAPGVSRCGTISEPMTLTVDAPDDGE